jgi:hypothetical protein
VSDKLARIEGEAAMVVGIAPRSFDDVARMAGALSKARGFVPDVYLGNAPALAAAIMTGMELGIGPMQAIRSIHIVKGKPVLDAALMLALAIRAGVKAQWLEQSDQCAKLRLVREGFEPHTQTFTMEDAKRAGLAGNDNYKKHPAAMLRARCISSAMRAFCPDVLGSAVYVEGEIPHERAEAINVETGEVREHEPPQNIEDAIIEAEASCAAQHEPPPEPPTRRGKSKPEDCASEAALKEWIARHGIEVLRRGEGAITRVVGQAARLGLSSDDGAGDARSWVNAQLESVIQGTEAA